MAWRVPSVRACAERASCARRMRVAGAGAVRRGGALRSATGRGVRVHVRVCVLACVRGWHGACVRLGMSGACGCRIVGLAVGAVCASRGAQICRAVKPCVESPLVRPWRDDRRESALSCARPSRVAWRACVRVQRAVWRVCTARLARSWWHFLQCLWCAHKPRSAWHARSWMTLSVGCERMMQHWRA